MKSILDKLFNRWYQDPREAIIKELQEECKHQRELLQSFLKYTGDKSAIYSKISSDVGESFALNSFYVNNCPSLIKKNGRCKSKAINCVDCEACAIKSVAQALKYYADSVLPLNSNISFNTETAKLAFTLLDTRPRKQIEETLQREKS